MRAHCVFSGSVGAVSGHDGAAGDFAGDGYELYYGIEERGSAGGLIQRMNRDAEETVGK